MPGSELLRRLNARDETPAGPAWVTLRSTADQVVTPVDSAALDGALDVAVQDLCPGRHHLPRRPAGRPGHPGPGRVRARRGSAGAAVRRPLLRPSSDPQAVNKVGLDDEFVHGLWPERVDEW